MRISPKIDGTSTNRPKLSDSRVKINIKTKNQKSHSGILVVKPLNTKDKEKIKVAGRGCEGDTLYTENDDIATD